VQLPGVCPNFVEPGRFVEQLLAVVLSYNFGTHTLPALPFV